MTKIGARFLTIFGILLGLGTATEVGSILGRWLAPGIFGALPSWLPEDFLVGIGFQFLAEGLSWIPALVFSAVVLTFSFWMKPEDLPQGANRALTRLSLLAVVTTMAFALVALLCQPWVDAALGDLAFRRDQTNRLEEAYQGIKRKGDQQTPDDIRTRMSLLKRLGQLRPDQSQRSSSEPFDYDFELQILKAHLDLDTFFQLRTLPGVAVVPLDSQSTVDDLLSRAEAALAASDGDQEFQANLWAVQAYRRLMNASDQGKAIDAKSLARAKAAVDTSWGRIYEKTLAADERKKASYFFRKGKSLGDFQFENYLEAYYGFQELNRENPGDQEVAQHEALALEKVSGQVLFSQDMDVLFQVPGSENLVFVNRETAPWEVIRVGKLLNTSQGVFLRNLEFLRYDTQGNVLLHWTAPYGRWTESGIDFRVWDKELPRPLFTQVMVETPGNLFNPNGDVDPPRFQPRVTVRDLEVVNADAPLPQTLGTWDLLAHGRSIEVLGYNSRLFQTEFVTRLASPFGFFVAILLVAALAWGHRAHDQGRSWWFLFPLLPLVAEFIVQTGQWISRLTVGGLLQVLGLEWTVGILAAGFVVASTAAVVAVHRQFHRSLQQS
jgi:hypothetical protein